MGVLEDFGAGLAAVPPLLLVIGHCTFVSLLTRGLREKFLLSFWVGLLGAQVLLTGIWPYKAHRQILVVYPRNGPGFFQ